MCVACRATGCQVVFARHAIQDVLSETLKSFANVIEKESWRGQSGMVGFAFNPLRTDPDSTSPNGVTTTDAIAA